MVIGIYEQISGLEGELSQAVEKDQNSLNPEVHHYTTTPLCTTLLCTTLLYTTLLYTTLHYCTLL
jgi:hypothetical protein